MPERHWRRTESARPIGTTGLTGPGQRPRGAGGGCGRSLPRLSVAKFRSVLIDKRRHVESGFAWGRWSRSRAVTRRLLQAGGEVTIAGRSGCPLCSGGPEALNALAAAVGVGVDLLLEYVCYDEEQAEQLLRVSDRVACLVVLSSFSVYADDRGRSRDEAQTPEEFPQFPGLSQRGQAVFNLVDPDCPTVAEIGRSVAALMGHQPAEIVLSGPPEVTVGDFPWAVARPFVASSETVTAAGPRTGQVVRRATRRRCLMATGSHGRPRLRTVLPDLVATARSTSSTAPPRKPPSGTAPTLCCSSVAPARDAFLPRLPLPSSAALNTTGRG